MIEIKNLSKKFGTTEILKDIQVTIPDGSIFGIVGASGVGKSTLLNCINGLEPFDQGEIIIDGTAIQTLHPKEMRAFKRNMGMIFQNFSLITRKTVFENIALPMECWRYPKNDITKRVLELAELVGLQDKLKVRPNQLSGGQKQRVAIARALALNPRYILSDESTSSLDPNTTKSMLALLKEIAFTLGITVVVVTHEMDVVRSICDAMIVLENGKVEASGKVETLFAEKPQALRHLLGQIEPDASGLNQTKVMLSLSPEEYQEVSAFLETQQIEYDTFPGKRGDEA